MSSSNIVSPTSGFLVQSSVNAPTVQLLHRPSATSLFQALANQSARQWVKIGAVSVTVVNGLLTDEQVDVYVNGVPPNFDLSRTPSKELSDAAGPNLESECQKNFPCGLTVGNIADTGGYNLHCKRVYHVTLPNNQKDGSQNQTVTQIVKDCLKKANSNGFSSIAVPDLGSTIGYPAKVLANLLFKAVEEFSKENAGPLLNQVVFCVPKASIHSTFVKKARDISKTVTHASVSHSKGKIGRIQISLKAGELANQQVDVIVCSGPENLKLKNGGMAESLLQAAGPGLQTECDQKYPRGIQSGDLAITSGHNLQCQFVYHGAIPKWGTLCTPTPKQILEDFVTKCLEEANMHKMTKTLAFPTLGTGSLNFPPDQVAQVMAECIKDFDQKYPKTELTCITIVVYSEDKKRKTVEQAFLSAFKMSTPATTPQGPAPTAGHIKMPPVKTEQYFQNLYKMKAVTPSYWTVYTSTKDLATWNSSVSSKDLKLVALKTSSPTYSAVEKLALNTWQSKFVGQGNDALGLAKLNYTKIKVTNVERLENPHLFEEYWKYREKIFLRVSQKGQFMSLGEIPQAKSGDVATTQIADPCLQVEIYPEINEHYLFHGTQPNLIPNIISQGLDGRIANSPFFGNGVYCAESSTKSDQYADPKNQRDLHEKKMLLVRACLGEMFIRTDTTNQHPYTRPPCKSCHNDRCNDPTHTAMFDSIVVDGKWNFREFILYDNKACYPEYLITYKRI